MSFINKSIITPSKYLSKARQYAEQHGYDKSKLKFSDDKKKKLEYDGVDFGSATNNDYIIYQSMEEKGKAEDGKAEMMRRSYLKRSTNILGNWKKNPKSKNMLAIKILWNGKL